MSKYANHCECGRIKPYMAEGCDKCTALEHATAGPSNRRMVGTKPRHQMHSSVKAACNRFLRDRGMLADF